MSWGVILTLDFFAGMKVYMFTFLREDDRKSFSSSWKVFSYIMGYWVFKLFLISSQFGRRNLISNLFFREKVCAHPLNQNEATSVFFSKSKKYTVLWYISQKKVDRFALYFFCLQKKIECFDSHSLVFGNCLKKFYHEKKYRIFGRNYTVALRGKGTKRSFFSREQIKNMREKNTEKKIKKCTNGNSTSNTRFNFISLNILIVILWLTIGVSLFLALVELCANWNQRRAESSNKIRSW